MGSGSAALRESTDTAADRARRECEEQGIPFKITDADALAFVTDLVASEVDR